MALLGSGREQLGFRQEEGTNHLRGFIESTIVSESPEIDRITRYTLYWHFYKGRHWRYYNETFLTFNYIRAFIDKVNTFLLGKKTFSTLISRYDSQPVPKEVESAIEGFIEYHWKKNKKVKKVYDILQMGSVSGDCWTYLTWNKPGRHVTIDVLDSRHCFPEFENGNVNEMTSFMLRQPLVNNTNNFKLFVTQIDDKIIRTWFQKGTEMKGKRYNEVENPNNFGFIPIVHLKNKVTSDEYYSRSDAADILSLNKVYNELAQEIKSTIDYYGSPTTVITGGQANTLRKGLGNIWSGLPAEANVFNLGLGEDLNASMQFLTLLKTGMHEIADIPENSLGKLQPISNTSAAALQVTYQPLVQQADLKWISYGEGIQEINKMMVSINRIMDKTLPVFTALPKDVEVDFIMEPIFSYGLPQDRSVELNQANLELSMNIASRSEIMNRLGKTNVPELLKEIDQDLLFLKSLKDTKDKEDDVDVDKDLNPEDTKKAAKVKALAN